MTKKVKNLLKRAIRAYSKSMIEFYKPCLEAGVNPFI